MENKSIQQRKNRIEQVLNTISWLFILLGSFFVFWTFSIISYEAGIESMDTSLLYLMISGSWIIISSHQYLQYFNKKSEK